MHAPKKSGVSDAAAPETTKTQRDAPFIPSTDWQDVPDWAAVPPGGEYRVSLDGARQARWNPPVPGPETVIDKRKLPPDKTLAAAVAQLLAEGLGSAPSLVEKAKQTWFKANPGQSPTLEQLVTLAKAIDAELKAKSIPSSIPELFAKLGTADTGAENDLQFAAWTLEEVIKTYQKNGYPAKAEQLRRAASAIFEQHIDEIFGRMHNDAAPLPPRHDGLELFEEHALEEPPQIIHGLLHRGLKEQVAGASKAMKSWLLLDKAICVATGTPWLGLATTQAKVLYLNLEIPQWHFQQRLKSILSAKSLKLDKGQLTIWNLRGIDLGSDKIWNEVAHQIAQAGQWGIIFVDPLYKLYNGLREENSTSGSGEIMKRFDRLAESTGAATSHSHHFSKGSPAAKEAEGRFSGSGLLLRDPDVYIAMTRHKEPDCFTLEFSLRCVPPIAPFVIRWKHPLSSRAAELDPKELRQPP